MTEPQLKPLASRDNPFVKRLHALAHSARERRKLDETVLDGAHLVEAALAAGVPLRALVVSETGLLREEHRRLLAAAPAEVPRYRLGDALFAHLSPVESPAGLLATIAMPASTPPEAGNPLFTEMEPLRQTLTESGSETAASSGAPGLWASL